MTPDLIMTLSVPVLLTIIIIVLLVEQHRIQVHHDKDQQELVNKVMARDYKDYAEGTHQIDMGVAAIKTAEKSPKPQPNNDFDDVENPDEVPVT